MYYVDNSTGVSVMPAMKPVYSTDPTWFTEGDSEHQPTYPGPDTYNMIISELINVLAAANMQPKKDSLTQLAEAISAIAKSAAAASIPDIGELYFTTDLTDPNTKYAGTTWEYLGEGLTLRTAKADGSDVGTTVGADSVTLTEEQVPVHNHPIGGETGSSADVTMTTDSFDYGSKGSDNPGDHVHTETHASPHDPATVYLVTSGLSSGYDTLNTGAAGNHVHTTAIGAHAHTGTLPAHSHTLPAATGNAGGAEDGSTTPVSVIPKSILVMVWVRTA